MTKTKPKSKSKEDRLPWADAVAANVAAPLGQFVCTRESFNQAFCLKYARLFLGAAIAAFIGLIFLFFPGLSPMTLLIPGAALTVGFIYAVNWANRTRWVTVDREAIRWCDEKGTHDVPWREVKEVREKDETRVLSTGIEWQWRQAWLELVFTTGRRRRFEFSLEGLNELSTSVRMLHPDAQYTAVT